MFMILEYDAHLNTILVFLFHFLLLNISVIITI